MIIFYDKRDGKILSTIDGRVHSSHHLGMGFNSGIGEENIGRFIIGWEETNDLEDYDIESEEFQEQKSGLFKKVRKTSKGKRRKLLEHNLKHFSMLQRFEDATPENPFDYRIEIKTGELIKVDKTVK